MGNVTRSIVQRLASVAVFLERTEVEDQHSNDRLCVVVLGDEPVLTADIAVIGRFEHEEARREVKQEWQPEVPAVLTPGEIYPLIDWRGVAANVDHANLYSIGHVLVLIDLEAEEESAQTIIPFTSELQPDRLNLQTQLDTSDGPKFQTLWARTRQRREYRSLEPR